MRLSQRVPKRSVATLDSPSNAVPIASLRDKNHVKVMRQIHQRIIASVTDHAPAESSSQQRVHEGKYHPSSKALFEAEICHHEERNQKYALKPASSEKKESHSSPYCSKGSIPVTPIPMTQQSDWTEPKDDSCFSLDSSPVFNREERIVPLRSSDSAINSAHTFRNDLDAQSFAPSDLQHRQSSKNLKIGSEGCNNLLRPMQLNCIRKEGSVGSSQFQQRLKALRQAGLIDTRVTNSEVVQSLSGMENEVPLVSDHVLCKLNPDKVEMPQSKACREAISHDHVSLIGTHRAAHEKRFELSTTGPTSGIEQESQPQIYGKLHDAKTNVDNIFATKPIEPKGASPFIYPLTFLKHMFSPASSCNPSDPDESNIQDKMHEIETSDSSNSFSFFSSPDNQYKAMTSSGRRLHPSERNRIKIQLSRRSGPPPPTLVASEDKAIVAASLSPGPWQEQYENTLDIRPPANANRPVDQSLNAGQEPGFEQNSAEDVAARRLGMRSSPNLRSGSRVNRPSAYPNEFGDTEGAEQWNPINGQERSPSNVEDALWEEFERQPSIQLLHSIRKDLKSQLASIISKLEQSLKEPCIQVCTPRDEVDEARKAPGETAASPRQQDQQRRDDPQVMVRRCTSIPESYDCSADPKQDDDAMISRAIEVISKESSFTFLGDNNLLDPFRGSGLLSSKPEAGVSARNDSPAAAHTIKASKVAAGDRYGRNQAEDKENIVNAAVFLGKDAGGYRQQRSKGLGQAPMRLAVREKDLWC